MIMRPEFLRIRLSGLYGSTEERLIAEAMEAARNADIAVIFAGLPDLCEAEGGGSDVPGDTGKPEPQWCCTPVRRWNSLG